MPARGDIDVVNDLNCALRFGKQYHSSAKKGFSINAVFRDERNDCVSHSLSPPVIGYRGFHMLLI